MSWKINNQNCLRCGGCVSVCPVGALELREDIVYNKDICILCGDCKKACPVEAIKVAKP
jgi:electron transfer flavoprotein alpha subunit